jgi:hypothetical protein
MARRSAKKISSCSVVKPPVGSRSKKITKNTPRNKKKKQSGFNKKVFELVKMTGIRLILFDSSCRQIAMGNLMKSIKGYCSACRSICKKKEHIGLRSLINDISISEDEQSVLPQTQPSQILTPSPQKFLSSQTRPSELSHDEEDIESTSEGSGSIGIWSTLREKETIFAGTWWCMDQFIQFNLKKTLNFGDINGTGLLESNIPDFDDY